MQNVKKNNNADLAHDLQLLHKWSRLPLNLNKLHIDNNLQLIFKIDEVPSTEASSVLFYE